MSEFGSLSNSRAIILGCTSLNLTKEEKLFFRDANPLGFILFKRNCQSPEQVRVLIQELCESIGRLDIPVLIDQEGGRVQRMGPPYWPNYLSAQSLVSNIASKKMAEEAVFLNSCLIAHDLSELGINVNCSPVLDVPSANSDPIIGDRAFSKKPEDVEKFGRLVCKGYLKNGVLPVLKHIPGHGRADVDSHKKLPVVDSTLDELQKCDFMPFKKLAGMPWAMTAHVVYSAIDPEMPATQSKLIIGDFIRDEFKFNGVLITDDLSMGALSGDFRKRAEKSLAAGCDIALHCNGNLTEMKLVMEGVSNLSNISISRLERAEKMRKKIKKVEFPEVESARNKLETILKKNLG